jgi:hypothetical protein
MFNVSKNGPNRLDLEFGGKLDSDDMRAALDLFVEQSKGIQSGRMLYKIGDFKIPTLGAIGVEFSRIPELLKVIKQFDRAAVLCNKKWVQKVSEFEGMLIPGLEIKAFDYDDNDGAEGWLAE